MFGSIIFFSYLCIVKRKQGQKQKIDKRSFSELHKHYLLTLKSNSRYGETRINGLNRQ
jgi:hypothetical protein